MAKKQPKTLAYQVTKTQRNVFKISMFCNAYPRGWEQWFLLTSDRHWDNPKSNWELQKAHLDEALERAAGVIDVGDFFCAMQGRWDPRASKEDISCLLYTSPSPRD